MRLNNLVTGLQSGAKWRPVANRQLGPMTTLGDMLQRAEGSLPGGFPALRSTDTLFVLSDCAGEHGRATHRVLTVLIFDPFSLGAWDQAWQPTRHRWLHDGRRMAFKRLEDQRRAKALPGFLTASEQIEGLLFSLAISRRVTSLLSDTGGSEAAREFPALEAWKTKPLNKLLLAIHVVSLLIAGLAGAGQDVFWYTDEDEIAPNEPRLYDACEFFARISSHYLGHNMRHFRFGTAKSDDGSLRLEDLLALPDLAAGAISEILQGYRKANLAIPPSLVLPLPESVTGKSRLLASWLADSASRLKKLIYAFEPGETGKGLLVRRLHLHVE